jgi:hypothetical protein
MATGARLCDVCGIHGRLDVVDGTDAVGTVTACTDRDATVPLCQELAVHARGVLRRLIDTLSWREAAHHGCVTVTTRAGGDYRLSSRHPFEPARWTVCSRFVARQVVAAVAIDALKATRPMNVDVRETRHRSHHPGVPQRPVAVHTAGRRQRLRRCRSRRANRERHDQPANRSGDSLHLATSHNAR